jgi:competence protein ComEC
LIGHGRDRVPERELAAACDRADIVISDRWLPRSCRPALLKADRRLLSRTGGLAIDLENRRVTTVAQTLEDHGWWRVEVIGRGARPSGSAPSTRLGPSTSSGQAANVVEGQR